MSYFNFPYMCILEPSEMEGGLFTQIERDSILALIPIH